MNTKSLALRQDLFNNIFFKKNSIYLFLNQPVTEAEGKKQVTMKV